MSMDIESLIQAYGRVIQEVAEEKIIVADESRLPASKQEIKAALLGMLFVVTDAQYREHLKFGYTHLSTFQPGVGNARIDLVPEGEFPAREDKEAVLQFAQQILESSGEFERWTSIVSREREQLVEELRTFGLWQAVK